MYNMYKYVPIYCQKVAGIKKDIVVPQWILMMVQHINIYNNFIIYGYGGMKSDVDGHSLNFHND